MRRACKARDALRILWPPQQRADRGADLRVAEGGQSALLAGRKRRD